MTSLRILSTSVKAVQIFLASRECNSQYQSYLRKRDKLNNKQMKLRRISENLPNAHRNHVTTY